MQSKVLIVGGGAGGVAAALALSRRGVACVMTEPTGWIGGQFTTQAVPPDENRWVEGEGSSRSYAAMREGVRRWYREHRNLTDAARGNPRLNPGNGWVSHLCAEPRVFHEVLRGMLEPMVAKGLVTVLLGHRPVSARTSGDRIDAVEFFNVSTGGKVWIEAELILDATETGDVYPLAGVEHMLGSESREHFGELHALPRSQIAAMKKVPEGAIEEAGRVDTGGDPYDQQACSWCFAIEHVPGGDYRGVAPERYEFWKGYVPAMVDQPWTGPLFSWTVPSHNAEGKRTFPFIPHPETSPEDVWDMWRYRRILDASIYRPLPPMGGDVCLVNWVQMDYWLRPLLGVDEGAIAKAELEARELSLSLLHWMRTDGPRWSVEGRALESRGYAGLKLRGDVVGSGDGLALRPYIREPRRLVARTIVTEGHIGVEQRAKELGSKDVVVDTPGGPMHLGEPFGDSVGIGHYTLDLHPSTAQRNSVYVPSAPFRIPLGSLVPVRVKNLIAAGKGIGVSHIANGCTRMHQVEWTIGEAAGTLAAACVGLGIGPGAVAESREKTEEVRGMLVEDGVPLKWSWEA